MLSSSGHAAKFLQYERKKTTGAGGSRVATLSCPILLFTRLILHFGNDLMLSGEVSSKLLLYIPGLKCIN